MADRSWGATVNYGLQRLHPGQRVCFLSGTLFGTIGNVREELIRIDAGGIHLWVSNEAVFTVEGNAVTLVCERRGLTDYVVDIENGQVCA